MAAAATWCNWCGQKNERFECKPRNRDKPHQDRFLCPTCLAKDRVPRFAASVNNSGATRGRSLERDGGGRRALSTGSVGSAGTCSSHGTKALEGLDFDDDDDGHNRKRKRGPSSRDSSVSSRKSRRSEDKEHAGGSAGAPSPTSVDSKSKKPKRRTREEVRVEGLNRAVRAVFPGHNVIGEAPDGNCMFHAIARHVLPYRNPERHEDVRREVLNYLEIHRWRLLANVIHIPDVGHSPRERAGGDAGMDLYFIRMRRDRQYGDMPTLMAAAELYGFTVFHYEDPENLGRSHLRAPIFPTLPRFTIQSRMKSGGIGRGALGCGGGPLKIGGIFLDFPICL